MKRKIASLALAIALLSWNNVMASQCSYEEQMEYNKDAVNINVTKEEGTYEVENEIKSEETEDFTTFYYFKIMFYNITDNVYIKLSNTANDEVKVITYNDTDNGKYELDWKDLSQVTTFTYKIITSSKTPCPNEELLTGTLTIPKFNFYHDFPICEEAPSSYLCGRYISVDINEEEFNSLVSKEIKKEKVQKIEEEKEENKEDSRMVIVGAVVFSIICIGLAVLLIRKGVKR